MPTSLVMATTAAQRGWGPGWPVNRIKDMVHITVGKGVKLVVHKTVAPIFKAFCDEIDARGYDLDDVADDWGYANREIRESDPKRASNHSWGLAIDLNATKNPMASTLRTDMPKWVVDLGENKYGLTWGGRYSGRKDAMHWEFTGTPKEAAQIIARIATNTPSNTTQEMFDMFAKDEADAKRAAARWVFLTYLKREPENAKALAWAVDVIEKQGLDALITIAVDGTEGSGVLKAERKLLGLK